MNFVFPPNQRIRQSSDFELAFRQKSFTNKWFSIHLVENNHKISRLGLVVSKRVLPKSVNRNFVKRLIRETFRLNSYQLPPLDFVVRLRRNLNKESSVEARVALSQLMLSVNNNVPVATTPINQGL